jgi:serine protease Do
LESGCGLDLCILKSQTKFFNMKKICLPLLLLGAVMILAACKSNKSVYDKYHQAVVMLYHKYLYKVTINDQTWYLTKDNENRYYWQKDPVKLPVGPMESFGTGFFIGNDGKIATNKHVVNDWFDSYTATFRNFFKDWIESNRFESARKRDSANRNIIYADDRMAYATSEDEKSQAWNDELAWKQQRDAYTNDESFWESLANFLPQAKFEVYTIYLGYALNGSYVDKTSDFKECHLVKSSDNDDIDLAVIQTNDKKTPSEAGSVVDISSVETAPLKVGDDVTMIGYNMGPQLANSKNGLMVQKTDGKISQESNDNRVLYSIPSLHGSSGSPVFNSNGKLVAVNYAGLDITQSFNYGILAKHLKTVLP